MKTKMTILGGALILGLNLVPAAHAAVTFNGPDLNGTRIVAKIDAGGTFKPATDPQGSNGGGCAPEECGTNGPDLTGTRVATVSFWGTDDEEGTGSDGCMPGSGCPTNGPDLTGTRIVAKISSSQSSTPVKWDELEPVIERDRLQAATASPSIVR